MGHWVTAEAPGKPTFSCYSAFFSISYGVHGTDIISRHFVLHQACHVLTNDVRETRHDTTPHGKKREAPWESCANNAYIYALEKRFK